MHFNLRAIRHQRWTFITTVNSRIQYFILAQSVAMDGIVASSLLQVWANSSHEGTFTEHVLFFTFDENKSHWHD